MLEYWRRTLSREPSAGIVSAAIAAIAVCAYVVAVDAGAGRAFGAAASSRAAPCRWYTNAFPALRGGTLTDVGGTARDDVWVVGYVRGSNTSVAFHWNGRSWRRSPIGRGEVRALAAFGVDDVWAVGLETTRDGNFVGLIVHWDGQRWRRVQLPRGVLGASLWDVGGSRPDDVWAVGSSSSVDGLTLAERAVALHWDGRRWQTVPLPPPARRPTPADPGEPKPPVVIDIEGFPHGVAARSRSDAWIVGSTGGDPSSPLAWHWNGVRWRLVGAPGPPQLRGLEAVTIVARDDVWAMGPGDDRVVHWDGRRWHVPPQPKPQRDSEVNALASGR
ncbi:MAG TPA: hypothetical protein VIM22_10220, partial [Solirubrobacteraceae bacterium]